MWRFYLIASAIVFVLGSIVFARRLQQNDWDVRVQHSSATPSPSRAQPESGASPPRSFRGQGSWVLSALPDCVEQESAKEGRPALLAAAVPPPRERLAPGTVLRRGRCTLLVGEHDVWIERGDDRLRIPPDARLFVTPKGLTLVWQRPGWMEIRVYGEPSSPGSS